VALVALRATAAMVEAAKEAVKVDIVLVVLNEEAEDGVGLHVAADDAGHRVVALDTHAEVGGALSRRGQVVLSKRRRLGAERVHNGRARTNVRSGGQCEEAIRSHCHGQRVVGRVADVPPA
jgi:hypothetical protein